MYVSQGIATQAFGITFRSKLEAMWAYELTEGKIIWDYVDSAWHDFVLDGKLHLEVKPRGLDFLEDAMTRAWPYRAEWHERQMLFVLGESVAIWAHLEIMTCDKCGKLHLVSDDIDRKFAWHPEVKVYGHWCEHGRFYPYDNAEEARHD